MERMLQYVWKHRLYAEADLTTTEGEPIWVIDPGIQNTDAGPDFFNAKIRVGDLVWVGNVEIHQRASNWKTHRHHTDKAYDSVILHVVGHSDASVCRTNREPILQVVMRVPEKVEANIEWLLSRDIPVACVERISSVPSLHLSDWMAALLTERLARKTRELMTRLTHYSKDWNEIFYITLMRNFGFGTNGDAFEMLARSLPYKYILKLRHNPLQVEALFLGQAGLLEGEGAVDQPACPLAQPSNSTRPEDKGETAASQRTPAADPYLQALRREYDFLRKKYNLHPVDAFLFKKLRVRPVNFPHVRLAQAAAMWIANDLLFSKVLSAVSLKELRALFNVAPSVYWTTHYHFGVTSVARKKNVGKNAADIMLINTVVPILFAYGKEKDLPVFCERALRLLEEIAPEKNHIVTIFNQAGISAKNAGDTQALVQLKREYCDKKKCLYCRIGFRLIGN